MFKKKNQAIQQILAFEYFCFIWVLAGHSSKIFAFTYWNSSISFPRFQSLFDCLYAYFIAQLHETFAWNIMF